MAARISQRTTRTVSCALVLCLGPQALEAAIHRDTVSSSHIAAGHVSTRPQFVAAEAYRVTAIGFNVFANDVVDAGTRMTLTLNGADTGLTISVPPGYLGHLLVYHNVNVGVGDEIAFRSVAPPTAPPAAGPTLSISATATLHTQAGVGLAVPAVSPLGLLLLTFALVGLAFARLRAA